MRFFKLTILFVLHCITFSALSQQQPVMQLNEELQALQKQLVPDKRVAILELRLKDTLQSLVIYGETDLPEAKSRVITFLKNKNLRVTDSVQLLPNPTLGEKTWALVTISVSNLRAKPAHSAELASQVLLGTPLKVLDYYNGWYRVQTPEKYIGWMESFSLKNLSKPELDNWNNSDRWIFNSISGVLYSKPDKKAEVVSDLVLGNIFKVESKEKGYLKVSFPDGRTGFVKAKQCISYKTWTESEPDIQSVLNVARQMMGLPYLWGGTSTKAVDCSGFSKTAYYSQAIILARDASQQVLYGEKPDISNFNNLQPGDLLFFGKSIQRVTHVAISLGKDEFIHASGRVHFSSVDPNDPKFVKERNFVAACRIINSLDTDGIVRVKNHPWYN